MWTTPQSPLRSRPNSSTTRRWTPAPSRWKRSMAPSLCRASPNPTPKRPRPNTSHATPRACARCSTTSSCGPELSGLPRLTEPAPSVVQQYLQDDAGGDRNQQIVAARLDPLVATRRGAQMMAAPVLDHVVAVAVFGRKPVAPVETMVRTGPAHAIAPVASVATPVPAIRVVARVYDSPIAVGERFHVTPPLPLRALASIPAIRIVGRVDDPPIAVFEGPSISRGAEGRPCRGQGNCHQGRDDCVEFHDALPWVAACRPPHALL